MLLLVWHRVVGTGPLRVWVKLVWGLLHAVINWLVMVWGEPGLGQSSLSTFQGPLGTGWEVETFQGHHEAQLKSYSCPGLGWAGQAKETWQAGWRRGGANIRGPIGQVSGGVATGNRQMARQRGTWSQGHPTKFSLPGTDLALGVWQRVMGKG